MNQRKRKLVHQRNRGAQFTAYGLDLWGAAHYARRSPRRLRATCPACVVVLQGRGLLAMP